MTIEAFSIGGLIALFICILCAVAAYLDIKEYCPCCGKEINTTYQVVIENYYYRKCDRCGGITLITELIGFWNIKRLFK